MCNSAWRAAWDAGWAAALHSLLLGRPGRLRSIGWSCSPPAPPPLPSWLAKDPIVEAKVELQQLAGAGDGPMCRLAGGWPTQLCGCRVQPARRCPSEQAARQCHGYNSRSYNSKWSTTTTHNAILEPLSGTSFNTMSKCSLHCSLKWRECVTAGMDWKISPTSLTLKQTSDHHSTLVRQHANKRILVPLRPVFRGDQDHVHAYMSDYRNYLLST